MAVKPLRDAVPYLLNGAFHQMSYVTWGDPQSPPVVCVHGLTRSARDFDTLAEALCGKWFVICPDLPGRGHSDWLPDGTLYQPQSYAAALAHLLAAIARPVAWVGTSLGGICGIALAASRNAPITRMVLNDIGPFIPAAAIRRIRDYMATGEPPTFATLDALEAYLRRVHAPFGRLSDAQWAHLARTSMRTLPDGRLALHYDPAIAEPIRASEPRDTDLWPLWPAITASVLAIRGVDSDLLLPETLGELARAGAQTHVVADAGHAPALMDAPTIERIQAFLAEAD
jgi:pimeloyl-ACP methyl ester carboxylesterase